MKAIYHLAVALAVIGACFSFGVDLRALVDAFCLACIAAIVAAASLVAWGWREVFHAIIYLLSDRCLPQNNTDAVLKTMAIVALGAGVLIGLLAYIAVLAGLPQDAQKLGRAIGFSLLSPFYGLYCAAFVFYPLSLHAARKQPLPGAKP